MGGQRLIGIVPNILVFQHIKINIKCPMNSHVCGLTPGVCLSSNYSRGMFQEHVSASMDECPLLVAVEQSLYPRDRLPNCARGIIFVD